jgi:hypothetical protein
MPARHGVVRETAEVGARAPAAPPPDEPPVTDLGRKSNHTRLSHGEDTLHDDLTTDQEVGDSSSSGRATDSEGVRRDPLLCKGSFLLCDGRRGEDPTVGRWVSALR